MTDAAAPVVQVHLTDYDDNAWLWVPHTWPHNGFDDAETWADETAKAIASRPGSYGRGRKLLRKDLLALSTSQTGETSNWTLVYAPVIERGRAVQVVRIKVSDKENGPYDSLEQFMQLDTPGQLTPPTIEPFTTDHLGEGLKIAKRKAMPSRAIAAVHGYGWEVGPVYLELYLAGLDLGRMLSIETALDGLARSLSLTVAGAEA